MTHQAQRDPPGFPSAASSQLVLAVASQGHEGLQLPTKPLFETKRGQKLPKPAALLLGPAQGLLVRVPGGTSALSPSLGPSEPQPLLVEGTGRCWGLTSLQQPAAGLGRDTLAGQSVCWGSLCIYSAIPVSKSAVTRHVSG